MKIFSWNVRGLGGLEKRKEVKKLVGEQNPFILCIQETKLGVCDDSLCASLWGTSPHGYSFRPSAGASGGLLVLWDSVEVEVWSSVSFDHVLRASLSGRIQQLGGQKLCLCGDFNVVRCEDERRSVRQDFRSFDHCPFNQFIDDDGLIDLSLFGRKWYKGDGLSMSRIDRFLLSDDWCLVWPNCLQTAQLRGLSDHCPLLLSVDEED
ncbi:endonuclease/exonuclease/phosphatase family protein [Trifolium medium]|uniref:Endonuclease/exonuclease/phosphatase family protein n=1 Tax=Trifolium medium TaxID=97028 RepID=A0A392M6Y7_9FABA|nr:endonuclease/exonuclease/phosphatase family protein [Trifolium medium]